MHKQSAFRNEKVIRYVYKSKNGPDDFGQKSGRPINIIKLMFFDLTHLPYRQVLEGGLP